MAGTATAGRIFTLPSPRAIAVRTGTTAVVASAVPAALFYVALQLWGVRPAVLVAAGWFYFVMMWRHVAGGRPIGVVVLGAAFLTVRLAATLATGSVFIYFVQPVAVSAVMGCAFALTARRKRPLLARLINDFVPVPEGLAAELAAAGFFTRLSYLWAGLYAVKASVTMLTLLGAPLGWFLIFDTVTSPLLTGGTVVLSVWLLRATLARRGARLTWHPAGDTSPLQGVPSAARQPVSEP